MKLSDDFTEEELEKAKNLVVIRRSNVTLPGEEVPPSVRANMSEEALEIERRQNLSFEENAQVVKAAAIAEARGIAIGEVTMDMLRGVETAKTETAYAPVMDDVRIKQAAAQRAAATAPVPTPPPPTPPVPTPPPEVKTETAKKFGE